MTSIDLIRNINLMVLTIVDVVNGDNTFNNHLESIKQVALLISNFI